MRSEASDSDPAAAAATPDGIDSGHRMMLMALGVLAIAGVVVGFYASLYPLEGGSLVAGFDTPWYLWRAKAVAAYGVEVLPELQRGPFSVHSARAGHPLLVSFLGTGLQSDPTRLAYVLPSVMGAVIGLAAATLAVDRLKEPRWSFPLYTVGVATSVNVVLNAVGHADALITLALVSAAAATTLLAAEGGKSIIASATLIAAAAIVHASFAILFMLVLVVLAVLIGYSSLSSKLIGYSSLSSKKTPLSSPSTPSGRIGLVIAAGSAAMIGAFLLVPGDPALPPLTAEFFIERIGRDVATYRIPFLAPLLVVGFASLVLPKDPARRRSLVLVTVWAGSGLAAAIVSFLLPVPAHRVLAFGLGVPILGAAGVVGIAKALRRVLPSWGGVILAAVVASLFLAGSMWAARDAWRPPPTSRERVVAQAEAASVHLKLLPEGNPIVFVIDPRGPEPHIRSRLLFDTIKAALEPDQIVRSFLHVGDPTDLLAGRPTVMEDDPNYTFASRSYLKETKQVLDESPIVVRLRALNRPRFSSRDAVISIGGPRSEVRVSSAPRSLSPPAWVIGAMGFAALGLLFAVGIGWAVALVPGEWRGRLAVAPALGMAVLVIGGVLMDRIGIELSSHWALIMAMLVVTGWLLRLVRRVRGVREARRSDRGS